MMPFLHEGNGHSVTITPAIQSIAEFKTKQQSGNSFGGRSQAQLHRVIQRPGPSSAAEIQRKQAQRKLQMAKVIGNGGGMAATLADFQKQQQQSRGHQMMMADYHNDSMQSASRRARSNNFTLKETFDLLKIWASPEMQWQMKHNFRNFRVWEAISYAMQELGHDRTAIQCKNRIQNLTSIFYRIKKSKQDYRSFNFPYYKIIGDVLDGKKNGSNANMPPNMAEFMQHFTNNGPGISVSPTHSAGSTGMAAHMALVEEYQHLINGNSEISLTPTGERSNSVNSTSGMNVLSPEVSISEGDSPIRVEQANRPSSSSQQASSPQQKTYLGSGNSSFANRNGNSSTNAGNSIKQEQNEEGGGVAMEDGSMAPEYDQEGSEDMDESLLYAAEDEMRNDSYPGGRSKRSMSAGFSQFAKSGFSSGNGMPGKRPRGLSSATTASTSMFDDPIGQYLSEMVDIERQWLDMERERAENERQMMMYMMQILQALVCPSGESQEDEEEEDQEREEGQGGDGQANEYAEDAENESEIRQMIEDQEEEEEEEEGGGSSGGGGGDGGE